VKSGRTVITLSVLAHLLAWGALLFLVFWPAYYQGVQATAVPVVPYSPLPAEQEMMRVSSSLIEGTGWWVLRLLLIPVALTALALAVALRAGLRSFTGQILMWTCAVLLLVLCLLGAFSIGVFYLPAGLALLAAALVRSIWGGAAGDRRPIES
jgi:hypothetical protein